MTRRVISTAFACLFVLSCAGCARDYYARSLISHKSAPLADLGSAVTGTPEELIKQGRIDLHRRFTMSDGAEIDVWVVKAKATTDQTGPKGTVLVLHGLLDAKSSFLGLGERLAGMGFDVVLPDLRSHGKSTGKYVTFGATEKLDAKSVMDALTHQGLVQKPVYAFGFSLGGAVAVQYAAIDPACKGVMAMAPYRDIQAVSQRMFLLMSRDDLIKTIDRAGQIGDFDPKEASTVAAAAALKCPLLLVHGLLDSTVPISDSQAIYDAAPEPKQLLIIPWGLHATLTLASEAWIAEQINLIATTGLKEKATAPTQQ